MAQPLSDILNNSNYAEPPEIRRIKDFVKQETNLTPKVSISSETYIVTLPSAAAAGVLRSSIFKLQKELGNEKRVLIRIG